MRIQNAMFCKLGQMAGLGLILGAGIPVYSGCTYDRHSATAYADQWAQAHNTGYMFFPGSDASGNDCANFVSQCLIAGGLKVEQQAAQNGMSSYLAGFDGAKTIPNVDNLVDFLEEYSTARGEQLDWTNPNFVPAIPSDVFTGDVITIYSGTRWFHSLIIVQTQQSIGDPNIYADQVLVDCHSSRNDEFNYHENLINWWGPSSPQWSTVKFFHIQRTGEEGTQACQGTGGPTGGCPNPPCCGQALQKITAPTEIE